MVTLNAHFDGKTIVPDEPLSLPAGTRLKVSVEPIAGPAALSSPDDRLAAWDAWVADMRNWSATHLPPGHTLDDSRESIYEGRGE
jgi:hypothetical protein